MLPGRYRVVTEFFGARYQNNNNNNIGTAPDSNRKSGFRRTKKKDDTRERKVEHNENVKQNRATQQKKTQTKKAKTKKGTEILFARPSRVDSRRSVRFARPSLFPGAIRNKNPVNPTKN